MNTQINVPEEPRYTYIEWKTLEQRKREYERNRMIYFIAQKVCGLLMAAIGIIILIFLDVDITISLFVLFVGLYLIFTKERVMMF